MANAYVVVGLGFGDEGKGSWVDHLVRKHDIRYTLRFNGGAQALHHVVTPEGVTHGFSQFGSGSFIPDTKTILSNFMLVEPLALIKESEILKSKGITNPFERLIISENAPIISKFHIFLNRIKEISREGNRHGSCGFGIGETQDDVENKSNKVIYVKDLYNKTLLREKLNWLYNQKLSIAQSIATSKESELLKDFESFNIDEYCDLLYHFAKKIYVVSDKYIKTLISKNDTVFEGAQGVLLDQQYGFFPYSTRSNTTFANAELLLEETNSNMIKIGLLRAYATRHGAGPFITEDPDLKLPTCHNSYGEWQQNFRLGWFDTVSARYALEITGKLDILAITNLDRLYGQPQLKIANSYKSNSNFFSDNKIKILDNDLSLLTQRTSQMTSINIDYITAQGFNSFEDPSCQKYIKLISNMINHDIHVVSVRPDYEKKYLLD
jgi:adenylosuccinate synthase